jgi:hypothetical protein
MLFEVGNTVSVDKIPLLKDLACNIQKSDKLIRLKSDVFKKDADNVSVISIDLALRYYKPKFSFTQASIQIDGRELLRDVFFTFDLVHRFKDHTWCVIGRIRDKEIKQDLVTLADILKIIAENV